MVLDYVFSTVYERVPVDIPSENMLYWGQYVGRRNCAWH